MGLLKNHDGTTAQRSEWLFLKFSRRVVAPSWLIVVF